MIAAPNGASGKTLLTTALCSILSHNGLAVRPFKKGPDYIDPMWLSAAAGSQCYNLDPYFFEDNIESHFLEKAASLDISIIEANHGLFDSIDSEGRYSNAALAKALKAPVILVVNAAKMGRSIAALVKGFTSFDPDLDIRGIIANNVSGPRHRQKLAAAIETYTSLPFLGAVQRSRAPVAQQYLGLAPPAEVSQVEEALRAMAAMVEEGVDWKKVVEIANQAPPLEPTEGALRPPQVSSREGQYEIKSEVEECVIGYALDEAFHFYYPHNLQALEECGAKLVPFSPIHDSALPDVDALYLGGGFPERYIGELAQNKAMLESIRQFGEGGGVIYGECGGLMYLCRRVLQKGEWYDMAGLLKGDVEMTPKPQGRGYVEFEAGVEFHTNDNPRGEIKSDWAIQGGMFRGHEFHYSKIVELDPEARMVYRLERGAGIGGFDGWLHKNTLASYLHLHALAVPWWAASFCGAARRYAARRR